MVEALARATNGCQEMYMEASPLCYQRVYLMKYMYCDVK